jgi:hypothetical protein
VDKFVDFVDNRTFLGKTSRFCNFYIWTDFGVLWVISILFRHPAATDIFIHLFKIDPHLAWGKRLANLKEIFFDPICPSGIPHSKDACYPLIHPAYYDYD